MRVDTIQDLPQPQQLGNPDEWAHLSNREILFLLQSDLVVDHDDIRELGASKIEQLCKKYHTITTQETRSLASTYIDRGRQDSSSQYLQGLQKVLRAIDRSIGQTLGECFPQTQQPMPTTEEPEGTVQDAYLEQRPQTRVDNPVKEDQPVENQ